ncbi:hypothetical protein BGW36DRAFT_429589 [Talaromyces proteolyticus]|uniref:Prenylated Rab acceptor 1 n=1 Tax=Talaromyces proteolyticus TaxID=1131652 RepID=A0AAD4KQS2_9EURO|nr:uncharacterized protein BGW36DRAFT_429589 [Talaromyces proteolyticus]KAH8693542.1 hypothetical protein BGW36DRAFT_429589 [Talaromyces proteolyticus]
MPRWGRPPGVRMGNQARRRATQWEDFDGVRFEEIDVEDDDGGVNLAESQFNNLQRYGSSGKASARELRLRSNGYDYESEGSGGEDYDLNDDADSTVAFAVQLAMREKEDKLVEKALDRIRRAQMLGKKNVKLSQEERAALERRRNQAPNKNSSSSKTTGFIRSVPDGKRRKSGEPSKNSTQADRRRSSHEQYLLDEPPTGFPKSPTSGFHASNNRPSSSSSRPRTPTMQSLRPQPAGSPLNLHQPAYSQRFPPDREPLPLTSSRDMPYVRALPDDPRWAPRQRSSSNTAPYPVEGYMYTQTYMMGPADPRLNYQGRQYATGMPYNVSAYPPISEEPQRGPSTRPVRQESAEEESSSEAESEESDYNEDEDEDDEEQGLQVEVVEQPPIRNYSTRSTAPPSAPNRSRRRNGR